MTYREPPSATGVRRALNRSVLAVLSVTLPGAWRRGLGWWRWAELLERNDYVPISAPSGVPVKDRAAKLWARGIPFPSGLHPLPKGFEALHKTYNWDIAWKKVSYEELAAWAAVWRSHRKGQEALGFALVGNAQLGLVRRVRVLLDAGADATSPGAQHFIRQLWGDNQLPFARRLVIWKHVCATGNVPSWNRWLNPEGDYAPEPLVMRWTASEMTQWQRSGLPCPTGEAGLKHALAWVDDPGFSGAWGGPTSGVSIQAIRWWKSEGSLPADANTRLLQTWVSTARMGSDYPGVTEWCAELLSEGLPPRPAIGPHWPNRYRSENAAAPPMPWLHWVAKCPFFENLPENLLSACVNEPDAWTAVNQHGESANELLEGRMHDARGQSRDDDLYRFRAFIREKPLRESWEAVVLPQQASVPRPRL